MILLYYTPQVEVEEMVVVVLLHLLPAAHIPLEPRHSLQRKKKKETRLKEKDHLFRQINPPLEFLYQHICILTQLFFFSLLLPGSLLVQSHIALALQSVEAMV